MTLNGVMAIILRYFTEFGKPVLQKTICGGIYARVYCIFTACTQCRCKESSRSLSHLLMSFLFYRDMSQIVEKMFHLALLENPSKNSLIRIWTQKFNKFFVVHRYRQTNAAHYTPCSKKVTP